MNILCVFATALVIFRSGERDFGFLRGVAFDDRDELLLLDELDDVELEDSERRFLSCLQNIEI